MPDPSVNGYGPFVLFQFAGAFLVLVALAIAIYRGSRDRRRNKYEPPTETRWFFDGPLNAALNTLRDIEVDLDTIEHHTRPLGEETRRQTELLREIRDELREYNAIRPPRHR